MVNKLERFAGLLFLFAFVNMCSETSDEEIYITQSTFCQQTDLADVNDRVLHRLRTDEQTLTANVEKQKDTAENRFANPISEVEIQAKIGDAVPKARFRRRISVASNAIQTIDNEVSHLIIYCFNCIRRDGNSTSKTGLNRQNIKKNGLSTCSRTGDSKEMRESAIRVVLSL